jgi:hypothetical protein
MTYAERAFEAVQRERDDLRIALGGCNRDWNEMRAHAQRYASERDHYRSEWVRVGAERDALALQVLVLEQQRDEARAARSAGQ